MSKIRRTKSEMDSFAALEKLEEKYRTVLKDPTASLAQTEKAERGLRVTIPKQRRKLEAQVVNRSAQKTGGSSPVPEPDEKGRLERMRIEELFNERNLRAAFPGLGDSTEVETELERRGIDWRFWILNRAQHLYPNREAAEILIRARGVSHEQSEQV